MRTIPERHLAAKHSTMPAMESTIPYGLCSTDSLPGLSIWGHRVLALQQVEQTLSIRPAKQEAHKVLAYYASWVLPGMWHLSHSVHPPSSTSSHCMQLAISLPSQPPRDHRTNGV